MKVTIRTKSDHRVWWLGLLVIAVYLIINLGLSRLGLSSTLTSYLITPLLWCLLAVVVIKLPHYHPICKNKMRTALIQLALACGFFQIVFYVIGGFFSGFGNSPSSFTPVGIITNLFLVSATLFGMEFSRAWLINHLGKHIFISLIGVALLYTALSLTLSQVTGFKADVSTLSLISSTLLPALAESLLATLLALLAGPLAAICYRGLLMAFWWFCPVLPDLSWSFKGLIGVIIPIVALVVVWNYYISRTEKSVRSRSGSGISAGWIATAVVSVAIIWFAVGIFPFHPVMVATGSMRPVIQPGDMPVIAKIPEKNIRIGDIVEYRKSEELNIIHRVVGIDDSSGQKLFITKGDANGAVDEPVPAANVVGKVIFNVPKIGWVASFFKQYIPQ